MQEVPQAAAASWIVAWHSTIGGGPASMTQPYGAVAEQQPVAHVR